jgi:hypothetical protein
MVKRVHLDAGRRVTLRQSTDLILLVQVIEIANPAQRPPMWEDRHYQEISANLCAIAMPFLISWGIPGNWPGVAIESW